MSQPQRMRQTIKIAHKASELPEDRRPPGPTAQDLCPIYYERLLRQVEDWIERGEGRSKSFYAPKLCQDMFIAAIEPKLAAEGYVVKYDLDAERIWIFNEETK